MASLTRRNCQIFNELLLYALNSNEKSKLGTYEGVLSSTISNLLATNYNSFVFCFDDGTSNKLSDGTYAWLSYDTLTIVVKESTPDSATVTLRTSGGGVMSGAGKYQVGDTATINAYPSEHYHFLYWKDTEGNEISKEAEYSFVVESDTTLYACF